MRIEWGGWCDVGGLYSDELETRREAARRLGAACREAGFFYLTGHRVGDATVAGLLAQAQAFFALPSAQNPFAGANVWPARPGFRAVSAQRPARYPPVKAGEHLYAQTLQSFSYLKERL